MSPGTIGAVEPVADEGAPSDDGFDEENQQPPFAADNEETGHGGDEEEPEEEEPEEEEQDEEEEEDEEIDEDEGGDELEDELDEEDPEEEEEDEEQAEDEEDEAEDSEAQVEERQPAARRGRKALEGRERLSCRRHGNRPWPQASRGGRPGNCGYAVGLMAGLCVVLLFQAFRMAYRDVGYDFTSYLLAARALRDGSNPYQLEMPFPYLYPLFPAFGLIR